MDLAKVSGYDFLFSSAERLWGHQVTSVILDIDFYAPHLRQRRILIGQLISLTHATTFTLNFSLGAGLSVPWVRIKKLFH